MVNLKSSHSENKALLKFTKKQPHLSSAWMFWTLRSSHLKNYFEIVLPKNFSYTLDNFSFTLDNYNNKFLLRTMDNFNFTNFLIDRVMGYSMKGASYCCFCKVVSSNYFQKVLLMNFISTYVNWLKR